jgi:predicted nucleic acid-binding protein
VRFWDTSAVVPLLVVEPATDALRPLVTADPSLVVWWATQTECVSALSRRRREGVLSERDHAAARSVLDALRTAWSELLPSNVVRQRAERLLGTHALRAADAFQLAAALLWARGETTGRGFVSFDERLRQAAAVEGFDVLPA